MKTQSAAENVETLAGKYLTVGLNGESYGIAVTKVREIIRHTKITPVPQMPGYVSGVLNLRGRVVAVVDLRLKFGMPAETNGRTCIVVVEVQLSGARTVPMGLVVDGVEEVVAVSPAEIEPTPHLGSAVNADYLLGLAKVKGQVKLLFDINRVVAGDVLDSVVTAA